MKNRAMPAEAGKSKRKPASTTAAGRLNRLRKMMFALVPLLLMGCGGSGGPDTVAGGGIGGTGITVSAVSVGSVSGFGSIIVNDVEFNTAGAEVVIEGEVRGVGDDAVTRLLSPGMVVRVEGRLDGAGTGTAARVVFNDNVEGPVESIISLDPFVTELTVMGQKVRVDDRTVYPGAALGSIGVGNVLELSGVVDQEGVIYATCVNKKSDILDAGAAVEVKGIVQNLNTIARRFTINSLVVDYTAAIVNGFSGSDPTQGALAEVKGRLIAPDTLTAASVVLENELGRDDVDTAQVEGYLTEVTSNSRFVVGTVVVATDAATRFDDVSAEDLSPGTRLRVSGALNNRIVLADEILLADRIKLESDVDSVDLGGNSLTLQGLYPVVVQANASTKFVGVNDLSQVVRDSHVKVFARATGSGGVVATKLLVKPGSGAVSLKGPVEAKSRPSLQVLGVGIDTSTIPAGSFVGKEGTPVSADEFFSNLQIGDTVNASGVLSGLTVIWDGVEIE